MKIRKHDFVLIDDELKCKLHKVVDMKIKIKKNYLNLMFLVNKKYGSTYTYIKNKWVRSKKNKNKLDIDFNEDIKGTNKDIFKDNNSQKLTEENIAQLKENNSENPYEVIQKLIDNSVTYKEKTLISKFKYVEKKLKRHLCQFTVYECNILNLMNFYYKYFPEKISYLRVDYLSNLLFHLNRDVLLKGEDKITMGDTDSSKNQNPLSKEHMEEKKQFQNIESQMLQQNGNSTSEHLTEEYIDTNLSLNPNVLIYDDSFGLLTSVLNIIYYEHVNIFSLIHKNASNSIIPSFGVRKNNNIVKISILNAHPSPKMCRNNWHTLNQNYEFVCSFGAMEEVAEPVEEVAEPVEEVAEPVEESSAENEKMGMHEGRHEVMKRKIEQTYDSADFGDNRKGESVSMPSQNDLTCPSNKRMKNNHPEENVRSASEKKSAQLQRILMDDIKSRKAESFVIIISSEFIYSTNTDVYLLIDTLIKISLKFLKNDSKIIMHTDDLNISNMFLKCLIDTNSFINIKLNEYILREQQVVKRRTHPVIKNAKLADGFLLTALKVEGGP
ncbi:tRNA (adenine(58)-N(1))-methyltransferase non-catalytic subunit TRM6 [Plasmodium gonderi]|uniref:tRNA (adenine(58)-N(1))-methyltransferase non-catalytic subunit TRM6 n=1 Tax=Plasmodium gonderi TaxID=77519 RepID=A0A1Y1JHF8_PLAGO|nr:tRNA (adenine(58)-N(1))-methyltransferase non-catalytic subunit TRM6 [Plasmodium gonderi]GAW80192.1 tRNA (adenine(58)-N(1))-methyltransferase non-catalytic subunit TRM6 [Plasmodium gonderi]